MNKNIFILVIQYLGIILLIAGVFLGANFYFNGLLYISIPLALVFGVIAGILAINLAIQKRKKEYVVVANKKKIIFMIIYFVVAAFSLPFFLHFFSISVNNKSQIQNYYGNDMSNFKITLDSFSINASGLRDLYKQKLENKYGDKKDKGKIDAEVDSELKPLGVAISEVKSKSGAFINRFAGSLSSWNLLTLASYTSTWNENRDSWNSQLTMSFNSVNKKLGGIKNEFIPTVSAENDISGIFTKFSLKNVPWFISLFVFGLVHFFVLIDYITIKSSEKGRIRQTNPLDQGTDIFKY